MLRIVKLLNLLSILLQDTTNKSFNLDCKRLRTETHLFIRPAVFGPRKYFYLKACFNINAAHAKLFYLKGFTNT